MDQYKTYFTEYILCKNGLIKPITKVKYIKQCPQCGGEMFIVNHKKGTIRTPKFVKWWCFDRICGHSEVEESNTEKIKRLNQI